MVVWKVVRHRAQLSRQWSRVTNKAVSLCDCHLLSLRFSSIRRCSINSTSDSGSVSSSKTESKPRKSRKDFIREYYYWIDKDGRLYLEETSPKLFTTALKDQKFLDFFFKRLKPNELDNCEDYPFVSECGKELNFVKSECGPIVFHTWDEETHELVYAGSLRIPLNPNDLRVWSKTSKLYHKFPTVSSKKTNYCENWIEEAVSDCGVFGSHLTLQLTHEQILIINTDDDNDDGDNGQDQDPSDFSKEQSISNDSGVSFQWKNPLNDQVFNIPVI